MVKYLNGQAVEVTQVGAVVLKIQVPMGPQCLMDIVLNSCNLILAVVHILLHPRFGLNTCCYFLDLIDARSKRHRRFGLGRLERFCILCVHF